MKKNQKRELPPVDIRDQQEMIKLGLHPQYRETYDWSKTDKEKQKLQKLRRLLGRGFSNRSGSIREKKSIPVKDKLVVYVWNQPVKSFVCMQHDIPDILARQRKSLADKILKYHWNGKWYEGNELPVWKPRVKGGRQIPV